MRSESNTRDVDMSIEEKNNGGDVEENETVESDNGGD